MRYNIHKQALLIGYYLKQELNIEPTVENIEKVINETPDIDQLVQTLENLIDPNKRQAFERELHELNKPDEI